MNNNFNKAAAEFMASENGKKINGSNGKFSKLASSSDGAKVKNMLDRNGFGKAVQSGDTAAMEKALSDIMRTEEGARMIRTISDMFRN